MRPELKLYGGHKEGGTKGYMDGVKSLGLANFLKRGIGETRLGYPNILVNCSATHGVGISGREARLRKTKNGFEHIELRRQ